MDKIKHYLAMLGPGLLFAGAAIGVSHLVQATRAGANYGFAMLWAVILILLFKYPFFEYGTRYTASKGETLLAGYKRMGKWVLWAYILLTPLTMFTIQAAVTAVTAGLFMGIFGLPMPMVAVAAILLVVCAAILYVGKYSI
jgi:Mn2+/Fe2+ NRAMP family transporter